MPKDMNFMQKRDCVDVAKDMLSKVDSDPSFIKWIMVTRRGFMSVARTPDIKRVNGVHPISRDRKNHVVFSRKRR